MHRLSAILLALLLAASGAAPASAASVVVSRVGLPGGMTFVGAECADGSSSGTVAHMGDGTVTPATGYLFVSGTVTGQALVDRSLPRFDSLTAWSATFQTVDTVKAAAFVILVHRPAGDRYLITAAVSGAAWRSVDLMAATFDEYDDTLSATGTSTTIDGYRTLHPTFGGLPVEVEFGSLACFAPDAFDRQMAFDTVTLGVSGTDTTYDFEGPPLDSSETITASKTSVKPGKPVTLATDLMLGGAIGNVEKMQLWAKPGGGTYAKVATVTTDDAGHATATVNPTINTTYQWRYPGRVDYTASKSTEVKVGVTPTVTIQLASQRVKLGGKIVATGSTKPKLAGTKISLVRHTSGGDVVLVSAKVRSDGSYSLTYTVHQLGRYDVFAKTASSARYASASSPTWSVAVS